MINTSDMINSSSARPYSLNKSRQIMKTSYKWYKKKGTKLSPDQLTFFESRLQELDKALLDQDQAKASSLAHILEDFCQKYFKKNLWDYTAELTVAILLALLIATLVRQVWFELYEIPTGSMRPTFKEQDHLTVSKTTFGINYPLMTKHLYFDPNVVQRTGIVIWSGEGIPYLDSNSTFMGIFPYTKRYIKRLMGKPGDVLYFYGGKIYGLDREGRDLVELRNELALDKLEHIPFINFDGQRSYIREPKQTLTSQVIFHQINQSIGRLILSRTGEIRAEIFNGKEWIKDQPRAQQTPHSTLKTYSDFWGIRNFAMTRILTKKQVETFTSHHLDEMEEGVLYLELRHTPSLTSPAPLLSERYGAVLKGYSTLIPLQEHHLKAIMDNMYTARFVVKNGRATRYQVDNTHFSASSPAFPNVPDGTYEFYYGKAVKVGWGGITSDLPADHPLYELTPAHVQKLFNMGIEMSTQVEPHSRNQVFFPYRYAYFREGDLYLLGAPVIKKEDPTLQNFLAREYNKQEFSTPQNLYVAFRDYGPPLKADGSLDKEFIQTFGFKIPEGHYLVLGDNHAMSQDSRAFGPIPQANLQGTPSLIIWPPSHRWGFPNQKPYPIITIPRLIVWSTVALTLSVWFVIHRRNLKKPIFKKIRASG
jgi:signal peptidase I